jgi:hypothetical protein
VVPALRLRPSPFGWRLARRHAVHRQPAVQSAEGQVFRSSRQLRVAHLDVGDLVGVEVHLGHLFSTWEGKPGIYLEDLFVRPAFRWNGGLTRARLIIARPSVPHAGRTVTFVGISRLVLRAARLFLLRWAGFEARSRRVRSGPGGHVRLGGPRPTSAGRFYLEREGC